jgi:NADP-dependent 3-hydroxy acid dehydrogenase YdfG
VDGRDTPGQDVIGREALFHRRRAPHRRPEILAGEIGTAELADTISDASARERMVACHRTAIEPDAIGRAIRTAIEQPADVDVNEIVVRPLATQVC